MRDPSQSSQPGDYLSKGAGQKGRTKLPCPFDIAEATAAIAEGDGCSHEEASQRALEAAGFALAKALAAAHAMRIGAALDRLPPPCSATGARLLLATRRFLGSPYWQSCIAAGWPVCDVFGVAEWTPAQLRDVLGLVPAIAFAPKPGRRLEAVTATGATFRDPDGRELTFKRPSLHADLQDVVPWWESPVLVDREAA